ncbi:hypothetical protein KSF73_06205 [Burkholderiaceae bacterium DAT-1]|nr:hypothetical protein [Burkholderiaceae bacterium DAT-1]
MSADIQVQIRRFFAAFDNRAAHTLSCADITAFFLPNAVIVQQTGETHLIMSPESFAAPRVELLNGGRLQHFHEWETAGTSILNGRLAMHRSYYTKSGILDGHPYGGSGTKHFQLVHIEGDWRIAALSWMDD